MGFSNGKKKGVGENTYPSLCHFNGGGIEVYTGSNGEALETHGHYSKII